MTSADSISMSNVEIGTSGAPDGALMASYPAQGLAVLIVEDEPTMAYCVRSQVNAIQEAFPNAVIEVVSTWEQASGVIYAEPPPTITLLDLSLPGSTMVETIKRATEIDSRTAVIIITGHKRDEVAKYLGNSKIEVLHKEPALWGSGNIIRACVRAMERKSLEEEKGRFSRLRAIIDELKSRGYATPETTV